MEEQDIIVLAYLELADKIAADVPEIKFIDLWADQLALRTDKDGKYPFNLPAVFIELVCTDISTHNAEVQKMDVQVIVRVAMGSYAESYQKSINRDSALKFGVLLKKVYKCLHAYQSDIFIEQMNRINWGKEQAQPFVYHWSQTYKTAIQDDSKLIERATEVNVTGVEVEKGEKVPVNAKKRFDVDLG